MEGGHSSILGSGRLSGLVRAGCMAVGDLKSIAYFGSDMLSGDAGLGPERRLFRPSGDRYDSSQMRLSPERDAVLC